MAQTYQKGIDPECWIDGVAISPNYESDEELLINVRGKDPYLSRNGGKSSALLNTKPSMSLGFLHMTGFPDFVSLLGFSPAYSGDRTIFGSNMSGFWRSKDAGATWESISRPVRYENTKGVQYCGDWRLEWADTHSAKNAAYSTPPGDEASLCFHGRRVRWIGTRGPDQGIGIVAIDGHTVKQVDLYGAVSQCAMTLYESATLNEGLDSIPITVSDAKNERSSGRCIALAALDVFK